MNRREGPGLRDRKVYDLNSLLKLCNICICVIAIIFFINVGDNNYVDQNTLYLLCILGAQNILILMYEKRKRDPFIIVLMFNNLAFYMVRVATLLYTEWSLALNRYSITSNEVNYSLIFIIFSNAAIFLGLCTARGKIISRGIDYIKEKPASPKVIIALSIILILFNSFMLMRLDFLGRIKSFLGGIFANRYILIFLVILYLIINFRKITSIHKIYLISVVTFFIITLTLIGSRSGVLTIFLYTLFGFLSVKGRVLISNKHILIAIGLLVISIFLFLSATFIRKIDYKPYTVITMERWDAATDFRAYTTIEDTKLFLSPLFDRVGFLDYATDLIINKEKYSKIISPVYYFKSIIDNGLTPGFNIFDVPKSSNALRYIYLGLSDHPTHKDVVEEYSSDMFTVYGEYYVLFGGYLALIFIFIFSYIFKTLYLRIKNKDLFLFFLYRALVLLIFHNWLSSFGMDWVLSELIEILIPVFLFQNFFRMRSLKNVTKAGFRPIYRST